MKKNRLFLTGLGLSLLFFLSGCIQRVDGVPTKQDWVWKFFVEPTSQIIRYFAVDKALGFGLAIIIVTVLVRLFIIMPLGLYQSWKATYQSEKRNYLSYIFDPLNERLRQAETSEEKMAAQTEIMAANKEYGISMLGGVGCLPILIQMPFFTALYNAASYTEGLAGQQFLWFQLDQKGDIPMTVIIALLYLLQTRLSMAAIPEEQREQMKTMMYMTPAMMVWFSFISQNGVALYWLVGGVFALIQQLMVTYLIKPRLKAKVEEEFRLNPPKPYRPQAKTGKPKDVTPADKPGQITINEANKKRNAGKQKR